MSRGRLVIGSVLLSLVAATAALVIAAVGDAGTNNAGLDGSVAAPSSLTLGNTGLVMAKFEPDASSGASTHTSISFVFPANSVSSATGASSDCATSGMADTGFTVTCSGVGTVQPGTSVKRFATFTATALGPLAITINATFDTGSLGKRGGGTPTTVTVSPSLTVVPDGSSDAGTCGSGGGDVGTAGLDSGALQQTELDFQTAAAFLGLPCTWGSVGVIDSTPFPKTGAPQVSSVAAPLLGAPGQLTLVFSSLPVPLSKFVLQENNTTFDQSKPKDGWFPVPNCTAENTIPTGADACLQGYTKDGKVVFAHLLFAGSGGDPWFN